MAEEEDKKEDKFDQFDSAGEALGYISLEQARLLAIQTAREEPSNYGESLAGVRMVFQLVEQEEGEDYYIITLSFRPEGDFAGTPGQEQFSVEKEGSIADRQVLSLPSAPERRRIPVAGIVIGVVLVAIAGGVAALLAGGVLGGEEDRTPVPALAGAATRTPTATPRTAATVTLAATPVPPALLPTSTPIPTPTPFRRRRPQSSPSSRSRGTAWEAWMGLPPPDR